MFKRKNSIFIKGKVGERGAISFPRFSTSSSLNPSLEVITICMRGEKIEIRRDASKPHLALSFLIGIASSPA